MPHADQAQPVRSLPPPRPLRARSLVESPIASKVTNLSNGKLKARQNAQQSAIGANLRIGQSAPKDLRLFCSPRDSAPHDNLFIVRAQRQRRWRLRMRWKSKPRTKIRKL